MEVKRMCGTLPKGGQIALFLISLLSILYTVFNRRLEVILITSIRLFFAIFLIAVVALFVIYFSDRTVKFRRENFFPGLFVILLLGIVLYCVGTILKDASEYKQLQFFGFDRNWFVPLTASLILTIGVILFYFRLYLRILYGLVEVIVGVIIGTYKASENLNIANTSNFYIIILTVSIYLIVRGLDNNHQGFTKEPYDLITKKMIKSK